MARWARGAAHGHVESAQHAALAVFVLVTTCILLLIYAFLTSNFSVRYVANNTNLGTPSTTASPRWGRAGGLDRAVVVDAHGLHARRVLRHRTSARELYPYVLTVMLSVISFFLLVMTVAAPVFAARCPSRPTAAAQPAAGRLRMITHPVALYLGFTGFTVPFAFAIAALITGRVGDFWITTTRRWTILAGTSSRSVCFIAAVELPRARWGGYWAWIPSRTPPSCLAHRHRVPALVMIQERRRMLRLWNMRW